MKRKTKRRSLATPDLTPLIDVVFLLLIFFMLATTFDKYGAFQLELPKGNMETESKEPVCELIIDKAGQCFLLIDQKSIPITLESVGEYVKGVNEITVTADKNLRYEVVVNAISSLKNSGVDKVELNFYE